MPEDPQNIASPERDPQQFLTYRLARLQSRLNAQAIRRLREKSDLSLTEWRILAMVAPQGETTLSMLVRDTQLDKGQLSRATKTLMTKGLLQSRVKADDHRQNLLTITKSGKETHDKIFPVMQARQSGLAAHLSKEELEGFLSVLTKLERATDT